jgi:hypothetical protein
MAKVPRFAEASAGRWPIVEMDNRTATSSSISVLQQPARVRPSFEKTYLYWVLKTRLSQFATHIPQE